ncbi:MAG: formimidoylglutamase [Fimbriimonadales bacterium]
MTVGVLQQGLQPISPALLYGRQDKDDWRIGEVVRVSTLEQLGEHETDLIVLGVPDDRAVVAIGGRPGANRGPSEIRRAWFRMTLGDRNQLGRFHIADVGDVRLLDTIEETHLRVENIVKWLFANTSARVLLLGGGHDIAYPHFAGLIDCCKHQKRVGIVNVDAHFDVRPVVEGINSGTAFWRLLEKGDERFRGHELVEFGVQYHSTSHAHRRYLEQRGATIVMLEESGPTGHVQAFAKSLDSLGKWAHTIGVSFDMDSVRMADAHGVSAPSPVGLSAADASAIAFLSGRDKRIRTLGIYEVSPPLDDGTAVRLAALMCQQYATGIASSR